MTILRALATVAAIAIPSTAVAQNAYYQGITTIEETPVEAYLGIEASPKDPWITTTEGALKGDHLNIRGTVSDSFGSTFWGGAYRGDYQLWDWESSTGSKAVGGMTLRVDANLFGLRREAAQIRVGAHNWGSNVTNGSVVVNGKTLRNWYLTDAALKDTYIKSTTFFNKTKSFGIGPFSVDVKAKSTGQVKLVPNVEMKDLRLTLDAVPSARVNVTASAGLDAWFVSARVEGTISPLIEAHLPATSYLQMRPGLKPCWNSELALHRLTMKGKLTLIVKSWINTWKMTIAEWGSEDPKPFPLINQGQPCVELGIATFITNSTVSLNP